MSSYLAFLMLIPVCIRSRLHYDTKPHKSNQPTCGQHLVPGLAWICALDCPVFGSMSVRHCPWNSYSPPSSQRSGSYQETWKAKHHYADAHKDEVIKHHGHGCVWMSSAKTSGSLKHGSPQPSSANSAECDDEPSSSQKDKNLEQM